MSTEFGQQAVQALARSLGSNLRSLSLRRGVIKPSFWPALSQHLPHLKELGLMHKVEVNSMDITAHLHTVTQPFTLYIGPGVLAEHITANLTDSIGVGQIQGMSVKQGYPADQCDFLHIDAEEALREQQQQAATQQVDEEAGVVDGG
jgi:hypothetical protein